MPHTILYLMRAGIKDARTGEERPGAFFARRTRMMRQCWSDARSKGHSGPTPLMRGREKELECDGSARAIEDQPAHPLKRDTSELRGIIYSRARSTAAVGAALTAIPKGKKVRKDEKPYAQGEAISPAPTSASQ